MSALSTTAPTSAHVGFLEPPVGMKANLSLALAQINIVGECAALRPKVGFEEEFEQRQAAYLGAERTARSIWGKVVQPDYGLSNDHPATCSEQSVTTALREADKALAAHRGLFSETTATMSRGIWIGPMRLCQGMVKQATLSSGTIGNQPILEIELDRIAWPALSEITSRAVNGELAVRMNGNVILQPRVHEALESGQLALTGPNLETLKAVQLEISRAC